nr:AMP-binding protein [Thiomonas sp.]
MEHHADPAQEQTLLGRLTRQARVSPETLALLAPGHAPISYAALAGVLRGLPAWLASKGLKPGARVAVQMPNGLPLAVATLALGAWATAVLVNPALGDVERLAMLRDARLDALLGLPDDAAAAAQAEMLGLPYLPFDLRRALAPAPAGPPDNWREPGPQDAAFVLFSSGTTGKPKRIPLEQAKALHAARNIGRHFRISPADRGLLVMPTHHIHGLVGGLLTPLVNGSSVVCTPGFDPQAWLLWIQDFNPSWYTASPTLHRAFLQLGERYREALPEHRFRFIRSSSSALPADVQTQLETMTRAPLIETYGMTEAAHQLTANPLPPEPRKPGSAGRAAGVELRIVDDAGRELPPDRLGAVVARGPTLFSGYEEPSRDDVPAFQDGWFLTGDLGRLDPDGYLYLAGRTKEIINRGGEKIAPVEVEQALLQLPGVQQAAVYAAPHPSLGEDVHAAVVLDAGGPADAQALRAALAGRIGQFKIPAQIHIVAQIPTGPGGKVQRLKLHAQIAALVKPPERAALTDPLQLRLAALFAAALGCAVTDGNAHFIALGGDSLLAVGVVQAVNREWGLDLAATALLAKPRLADFAAVVQAAIEEADAAYRALQADLDALGTDEIARLLAQA